jgi:hypothetical protein
MPLVKKVGPYEFRFHSRGEAFERPHIHVRRERKRAKFWMDDVQLVSSKGFAKHELNRIEIIVNQNQSEFLEAWHEYFG